jgi:hypothetical protein
MDLHPTLILIHILAALVFVIAHAVSAVAMFQVRNQSDRAMLTATLNRSSKAMIVAYVALLVLLVGGVIRGFVGSRWGSLWIWVSLVLFVVVSWAMLPFAATPMSAVRAALGIQVHQAQARRAAGAKERRGARSSPGGAPARARARDRPRRPDRDHLAHDHKALLRTRTRSGHPIALSRPLIPFSS